MTWWNIAAGQFRYLSLFTPRLYVRPQSSSAVALLINTPNISIFFKSNIFIYIRFQCSDVIFNRNICSPDIFSIGADIFLEHQVIIHLGQANDQKWWCCFSLRLLMLLVLLILLMLLLMIWTMNDMNDIIINDITDKTGVPDVAGQREISCWYRESPGHVELTVSSYHSSTTQTPLGSTLLHLQTLSGHSGVLRGSRCNFGNLLIVCCSWLRKLSDAEKLGLKS